LIFLGLVQIGAIKFNLLEFDYAWKVQKRLSHLGFITAFVTGIAAALSWIPCIGPLLSPILLLAANSQTAVKGSFLLFIYGLGLTVPFILGGLFFPSVVHALRNHRIMFHRISQIAGLFLVLFGVVLLLDKYQTILDIIKININDNALQFWNFIDKKIQT
jgi:cytochrome c-type biogenesis protein